MQSNLIQNWLAMDCMQSNPTQNWFAPDGVQSNPIQNCLALDCMQSDIIQNWFSLDCMQSNPMQNCFTLDGMQSNPIQNCIALDCTPNEAFLFCINKGRRGCDLNQNGFKREGRLYEMNPKSGYSFLSVGRLPSARGRRETADGEGFFTCVQ